MLNLIEERSSGCSASDIENTRCPCSRCTTRLRFAATGDRLTHYLFRYPAKFHPPLARKLIEQYTSKGDTILDPFCGSGTLLVEAAASGRRSIGTDVDPVAIFVASVKTQRLQIGSLESTCSVLLDRLQKWERTDEEYQERMFEDLTEAAAARVIRSESLWVPSIPQLSHWFRWYVVVDLARILKIITSLEAPASHVKFCKLCFASIIRNSSNADPVPVSGLEVTAHMRKKDAEGRLINPFAIIRRAITHSLEAVREYLANSVAADLPRIYQADATKLRSTLSTTVDAVITSPPYHNAVDYYRRHQLEMYWLKLVDDHLDRLALLPKYIGRSQVRVGHQLLSEDMQSALAEHWFSRMALTSTTRANAFKHYLLSMHGVMREIAGVLRPGSPAVFVVGNSRWNGEQLPTSALLGEMAREWFDPAETLWYPIKNRYMSYQRHNGASISEEYVTVLRRKTERKGG